MAEPIRTDLCVIGAGSGGLAVAAGAVQMGAEVVLIEKGKMGGDCLNYGCVPSKSLIAAGKAAQTMRTAGALRGQRPRAGDRFRRRVHDHVKGVIAAIAPHDSEERFAGLGVKVLRAPARFVGPREVEVGGPADPGAPLRDRDRLLAGGAAGAGPGRGAAPDQRDDLRSDRAAGASDRARRRPDRLRAGAGAPPARRAGDRARAVLDPAQGRSRRRSRWCAAAAAPRASTCASRSRSSGVAARGQRHRGHRRAGRRRSSGIAGSHLLVAAGRRANVEGLGLEAGGRRVQRQRASRSTRGCAPATSGSSRSATSRAACSSPTWRPITPAS